MLKLEIPPQEFFDESKCEFIYTDKCTLTLEHSLIAISKWEAKWHKPFLSNNKNRQISDEELKDYIRCMTVNQNVPDSVYACLTKDNIQEIYDYMNNPMSATTVSNEGNSPPSRDVITSELIYYWMISLQIPVEFEKWHLNRLIKLIEVCSVKNSPPKKMGKKALMNRNTKLNAMRRKSLNTKG